LQFLKLRIFAGNPRRKSKIEIPSSKKIPISKFQRAGAKKNLWILKFELSLGFGNWDLDLFNEAGEFWLRGS
jgi:hypothetical protein